MVCSRTRNLLSAYCDRELSGAEMLEIQRHLGQCPECHAEHEGLMAMKRLLGAGTLPVPSREFDFAAIESRAAQRSAQYGSAWMADLMDPVARWGHQFSGWLKAVFAPRASLRLDGSAMALGCALGALILTVGAVRQPSRAATAAQIPVESASGLPSGEVATSPGEGLPLFAPSVPGGGMLAGYGSVARDPWSRSPGLGAPGSAYYPSASYVRYRVPWSPR